MLREISFIHTQEAADAAFDALDKTELRSERIKSAVSMTVCAVVLCGMACQNEKYIMALLLAAFCAFSFFKGNKNERKSYESMLSPETVKTYQSLSQKLMLYDDHFIHYGEAVNPTEYTQEDLANEEYMRREREINEEISHRKYKIRAYTKCCESDLVFVIRPNMTIGHIPILKSQLEDSEVEYLRAYFTEKLSKRYKRI